MSRGIHKVVLYVHEETKLFFITARMERARLPGVDDRMSRGGYSRIVLAENLDKAPAEELKDRTREEHVGRGYRYHTQPQLS